ncbi:hypothetical protein JWZ98_01735 [Methylomonas sp. EFPC1]|uniref:hypothetical protein n=1 Tax=Methylomonas sp. EFPC1 TaxID=2812647 RepID=UPI00101F98C8|nr:hypothetical protein [Methylomonas sp. EFPC1]QSB01710.1 hypothetical protein JWZ98_01735 [Methylomonas sp. EFPC1]
MFSHLPTTLTIYGYLSTRKPPFADGRLAFSLGGGGVAGHWIQTENTGYFRDVGYYDFDEVASR